MLLFSLFILLLVVTNLMKYIYNNDLFFNNESQVLGVNTNLELKKEYWNGFLAKHPNYFPGWTELVEIELELGNQVEANIALQKAIDTNPNNPAITTLMSRVEN